MREGQNLFARKRFQETFGGGESFFEIAGGTAGDEVGRVVGAAAGDGEDVVEGPFAGAEDASAVEAAAAIAAENVLTEIFLAKLVGTRPGAGLAGGVAVGVVRNQGKLLGNGSANGAGGNLAGEEHFVPAAARAAVENAKALLADEHAKIVPRRVGGEAGNARGLAARNGDETASCEARAAEQMVVERAFVRAETKRGNEPVLDGGPHPGGRKASGHDGDRFQVSGVGGRWPRNQDEPMRADRRRRVIS